MLFYNENFNTMHLPLSIAYLKDITKNAGCLLAPALLFFINITEKKILFIDHTHNSQQDYEQALRG